MTAQKESVVTPERFAQGLTYTQWMEQIDRNKELFVENYDGTTVDPEDTAAIKALMAKPNGPGKMLAIAEAWCPDVYRGLPAVAKLAEATGLELRIVFRDQNMDIMNEFLNKGEFQSVPTVVLYTKDHKYIAYWSERPQLANEQMPMMREITARMRDPELSQEEREKLMQSYQDFQRGPIWGGWRTAAIKEIRQLLEGYAK